MNAQHINLPTQSWHGASVWNAGLSLRAGIGPLLVIVNTTSSSFWSAPMPMNSINDAATRHEKKLLD